MSSATNLCIGILGGGQLARMLALAAHSLGIKTKCVDPNPLAPASQVTECGVYYFDDIKGIKEYFSDVTVVTYEFENVSLQAVKSLTESFSVLPAYLALEVTQNRIREKTFCENLGVPVPKFVSASGFKELLKKREELFFPSILKRTSGGYDGKGQWRLNSISDLELISKSAESSEFILEELVCFDREYSCICVRSAKGEIEFYSLCENKHIDGVLFETLSPPVSVSIDIENKIRDYTKRIADALSYVGVLAIEFFVKDENIYFNEFAPRVHNTGHWTIEGAVTSQFENHIRACAGLPLGSADSIGLSLMFNLLGTRGDFEKLLNTNNVHYHWYGKNELGNKRKVGHITFVCGDEKVREKNRSNLSHLVS